MHDDVRLYLEIHIDNGQHKETLFDNCEVIAKDHGRIETRRCWVSESIDWLTQAKLWMGLKSIGLIEYERFEVSSGKTEVERCCFISSLPANAEKFASVVGTHWGIESAPQAHKKEVHYEELRACA